MNINQISKSFEAPKVGVYKIEVMPTGSIYFGSSINIRNRINAHLTGLNTNKHFNYKLQELFNIYGLSSFKASIIEECAAADLELREQFWISCQLHISPDKLININKIATRATPESIRERLERNSEKFRQEHQALTNKLYELQAFIEQRSMGRCERCGHIIRDGEYYTTNHMVRDGAIIDAVAEEYILLCSRCQEKHLKNYRLTKKLTTPLFLQTRKEEDMKGYNNLGKPVTIERFNNARSHLVEMYPNWTREQHYEVLHTAKKLVEADDPDSIWGHVNACPPLDKMDWVSRMRLGAALLAE